MPRETARLLWKWPQAALPLPTGVLFCACNEDIWPHLKRALPGISGKCLAFAIHKQQFMRTNPLGSPLIPHAQITHFQSLAQTQPGGLREVVSLLFLPVK